MAGWQAVVIVAGLALAGCVIVQTIPREERAPAASIGPPPAARIIIEQRPAVPAPRGS